MAINIDFGPKNPSDRIFNKLLYVLEELELLTSRQRAERVRGLEHIKKPGLYSQLVDKSILDDPPMNVINALLKATNYKGDK